jgi:hypothetical protein
MEGDIPAWAALIIGVGGALIGWGADRARAHARIERTERNFEETKTTMTPLVISLQNLASKIDLTVDRLDRLTSSVDDHLGRYARKFNEQSSRMHSLDRRLYGLELRAGIPSEAPEEHTPMAWAYEVEGDRPKRSS